MTINNNPFYFTITCNYHSWIFENKTYNNILYLDNVLLLRTKKRFLYTTCFWNFLIFIFQVRKTSVRMTAIKEYPFDLSDLQKEVPPEVVGGGGGGGEPELLVPVSNRSITPDGKRRVSIMVEDKSKERDTIDRLVSILNYRFQSLFLYSNNYLWLPNQTYGILIRFPDS